MNLNAWARQNPPRRRLSRARARRDALERRE